MQFPRCQPFWRNRLPENAVVSSIGKLPASQEATSLVMDLKLNSAATKIFSDNRHSSALGTEVLLSAVRAPIPISVAALSAWSLRLRQWCLSAVLYDSPRPFFLRHFAVSWGLRRGMAQLQGKGADLTPPCVTSLATPHRPKASDGSLEPRRREYL